jgi:hypothetical protein
MFITNRPEVALIAERSGVDWIFLDLEILGKTERQAHVDSVISRHTVHDVRALRRSIKHAQLLVRVNPIHPGSRAEIDAVIDAGADIVMLPYFSDPGEVEEFIGYVDGRAQTNLLFETPGSIENASAILRVPGIDFAHIGLNDLHLAYAHRFMFEVLTDGTVEHLTSQLQEVRIPFGIGGIARIGHGEVPAELLITEHYRLGSSAAILSRSFANSSRSEGVGPSEEEFRAEVARIRDYEATIDTDDVAALKANQMKLSQIVSKIAERRTGSV